MAITDTKQAKDFTAGAPNITLKGDLTPTKMAMSDDANERALEQIFEQLLEEGFSIEDAAKKAREIFNEKAMADGGRVKYGLGSLVKKAKKVVKGVVKGVKKNPLLAAAALNFAPMLIPGGSTKPFFGIGGLQGSIKTLPNPLSFLGLSGDKEGTGAAMDALKIGGLGATITGLLAQREQLPGESESDFSERRAQVNDQLKVQFSRLYPQGEAESDTDYDVRITAMVEAADDSTVGVGNMAAGGRVGYASGTQFELPFGKPDFFIGKGKNKKAVYKQKDGTNLVVPIGPDDLPSYAIGGRAMKAMGDSASENAMQAAGIEGLPLRENSKGVKEIDLRETGGFIPPVGVKEKADDIPAMLSNNEFVFTADAVRAAGGGSVNKGAQRMYDLMKNLESKVV